MNYTFFNESNKNENYVIMVSESVQITIRIVVFMEEGRKTLVAGRTYFSHLFNP